MGNNSPTLSEIVKYLTFDIGMTIGAIADDVEIGRTTFYRIMNGQHEGKRNTLARKLLEKYPEHFPNGDLPSKSKNQGDIDIQIRYIERLEKTVASLEAELDKLKAENMELLREIKNTLIDIKSRGS